MFEVVTGPMHCGKTEFVVGEMIRASIASRKRNKQKAILVFTPAMDERPTRGIEDQIKLSIDRIQPYNNPPDIFREASEFAKFWEINNPGFSLQVGNPLVCIFKTKSLCHALEFLEVIYKNTPRNSDEPLVVIDEVQLYSETKEEIEACYRLWSLSHIGFSRIIVGGLNADFANRPFILTSLCVSLGRDKSRCLSAVCDVCGEEAQFTQRLINGHPAPENSPRYVIGDAGSVGTDKYEYQARCSDCWKLGPSVARKQNKQ